MRLQLAVLAYNLGILWRRLGLPQRIRSWSLTSLQHRLMKTGGRLVKHARYYWLLLAEGHLNRKLFGENADEDLGAACAGRMTPRVSEQREPGVAARRARSGVGRLALAGLNCLDRPQSEARSGARRRIAHEHSPKTVAPQPWIGYPTSAWKAKKEILVK